MNNEIKEILNDLQRVADRKCYPEDILDGSIAQEWVDYITNLQEEKDYYFKKNNELSTLNTSLRNDRDILKTRNEKAIELLNDWNYLDKIDCYYEPKEVIDILKGE